MGQTDERDVDREVQERLRAELAGASWFALAAATARAHRDVGCSPPGEARRAAERRYQALRDLLHTRTDDLSTHPVYGGAAHPAH